MFNQLKNLGVMFKLLERGSCDIALHATYEKF